MKTSKRWDTVAARDFLPVRTGPLRVCVLALLCVTAIGCRRDPGRWDQTQEQSQGNSAQEASAQRLNPIEGTEESAGTQPPPFTPDQPGTADEPVTWKPKGEPATESVSIDVDQLTNGDPLPGGEFNKFFPKQSGDDDMVAKQEKQGFAQYSLRRGGEEIAQLSVTDLRSNPQAAAKFEQPDMQIDGFPAKKDGSKGTTLLVKGRFQVKVRSPQGNLNESDRVAWLQKFDLAGIAGLAD